MVELPPALVPVVTPFTDDATTLSEIRMARLLRWYLDAGVAGFVTSTDAGEFMTTSFEERKNALEICVRESQGRAAVLAHVSTLSTGASLDLAQHAARHGARAVVLMPPYYGTLSDEEIVHHVHMVAQHGGLDVLVVDPQGRVSASLAGALRAWPQVTICSPLPGALGTTPTQWPSEFAVGSSVCLPVAAILPDRAGDIVRSGSLPTGWKEVLSAQGPTRILKTALGMLEREVGPLRTPYSRVPEELRRQLAQLLGA